jgi:hypothetical protein
MDIIINSKQISQGPLEQQEAWINLLCNVCDSILAYNWSLPANEQYLNNIQLGVLGIISSYIGFSRSWASAGQE